jgi:type 1 fimbriae regulatory protein FimB
MFNCLVAVIGRRAGLLVHVHPHMLRHSCGDALANQGRDTRLIQDDLGHRNVQHTVRYTRTAAGRFEGLWR